jgi:ADP-ribosyl-[dinitrogen reductase] hydrolase
LELNSEVDFMVKQNSKMKLRTSETHPLIINWVESPSFTGKIGITLCPGKFQPISWSGGWNRDLQTDISTIVETGSTTVITLIEDNEIRELKVPNLGKAVVDHGLKWIHLPIEDTTAPTLEWIKNLKIFQYTIVDSLNDGDSIVIHCKGGLSRAGTLCCIILSWFGINADSAVKLVRKKRSFNCINQKQQKFLQEMYHLYSNYVSDDIYLEDE